MRTANRLAAAAALLLAGCADSPDPIDPLARSLAVAGDLVVNTLDDGPADGCTPDHCSLRDAVEAAEEGQTIVIGVTGTIQLQVFPIFIDRSLSIVGPGTFALTVAGPTQTTAWGALLIAPDVQVRVTDLRVSGGNATFGGGIRNHGHLVLETVVVEGNTAGLGGGILNSSDATLHMSGGAVRGNSAVQSSAAGGGGIFNEGHLILERVVIGNNTAAGFSSWGAGIYNTGALEVRDSRVAGNAISTGPARGAGIWTGGANGSAVIERTAIVDNRIVLAAGSGNGGGIAVGDGLLRLRDSEVSGNLVDGFFAAGGGIDAAAGTVEVENTIIRANTVRASDVFGFGAAIASINATVALRHVTVVDNEADAPNASLAGAVRVGGGAGTLTLLNSVVTGNLVDWDVAANLSPSIRGNVIGTVVPQAASLDPANSSYPQRQARHMPTWASRTAPCSATSRRTSCRPEASSSMRA